MKKQISRLLALAMVPTLCAGLVQPAAAEQIQSQQTSNQQTSTLTVGDMVADTSQTSSEDALSALYDNYSSGFNEDGSVDDSIYDYKENQVLTDTPMLLSAAEDEDESYTTTDPVNADAFDLRHVGGTVTYNALTRKNEITGGTSYVTPVKFQNPWGTCWAFGIVAASEISILYELGLGTSTVDNTNIDLSEHHLAWFAKNHIPAIGEEGYGTNDVSNQDGEGFWYFDGVSSDNMSSGAPYYGTSVFASGMGIVDESFAPYVGKEQKVIARRNNSADASKYPTKILYYDSVEDWEAETNKEILNNYTLVYYSDQDDWTLDESMRFYQTYALEESNVLPSVRPIVDEETGEIRLNEDGIEAIKSELVAGKGVQISFFADSADPNKETSSNTARYINKNFAHYNWDKTYANHAVCIVGWDDDYDASNFGLDNPVKYNDRNQVIYKLKNSDQELTYSKDGKSLYYVDDKGTTHTFELTSNDIEPVRETDGSVSVPSGNGAWIVKNSWGATTNEFPNKYDWGIDGTGYFYLSYYDTSIRNAETFDFAVTENEQEEYDYSIVDEYDYMPASSTSQIELATPSMMANVFVASEDMSIEALSCETTTPGTTVIYGICLLEDDEDYPADNDVLVYMSDTVQYKYGGYHRIALDEAVQLDAGQKYAVIVEEYVLETDEDGELGVKYCICANTSFSMADSIKYGDNCYNVGIINPGESYIMYNGETSLQALDYNDYITRKYEEDPNAIYKEFDNFSIKAYASPRTHVHELVKTDAKAATFTEEGNTEYWTCTGCGRYFADAEGTVEIEKDSWIIPMLTSEEESSEPESSEPESSADTSTEASSGAESSSAESSSADTTSAADHSSEDQPGTGDHTQVVGWMAVSIAALAGIIVCVIIFKSRKAH